MGRAVVAVSVPAVPLRHCQLQSCCTRYPLRAPCDSTGWALTPLPGAGCLSLLKDLLKVPGGPLKCQSVVGRLWFFYAGTSWINQGIEALHCGQH